jgi:transcriptional regulator with XRE-family HTH domain
MMTKDVYIFWQWVQQRMEYLGIPSFRELEKRAGLSNGAINSRKNDLKFPTVEMAEGLCHALQVSWLDLWEQAGFVQRLNIDELAGLDAEIYRALQGTGNDFKQTVLKTIQAWRAMCENRK